jgi:aminopeptidase N
MYVNMRSYLSEDPSRKRHPLLNTRYPLSMDLFDETTYKKGAYVIHMLRETVGDEMFWKSLNVYLNEFKYGNVESRDLQRVFEKTTGQQLDWFFDQWVYKAGYPELRVRSSYNPASRQLTLTISQTQKADAITPSVFRLPVEIEIVTPTGARTERIEINQRTQTFNFQLDGRPTAVTFDKRASVLKKLDFPQPRAMAAELLIDGADVVAVKALQKFIKAAERQSDFEFAAQLAPPGSLFFQRHAENSIR